MQEQLFSDSLTLRQNCGLANRPKDIGVIRLSREQRSAIVCQKWRKRAAAGKNNGSRSVSIGFFKRALRFGRWIRKGKDDWALVVLVHSFQHLLGKGSCYRRNSNQNCGPAKPIFFTHLAIQTRDEGALAAAR